MKKMIGMMALGMGIGAGSVIMYDQFKNGNIEKVLDKASKTVSKSNKNNDSK